MGKHGKPLSVARYMTESRPGHPTAHADGRVRVHRAVLYDSIGPGTHPCHWCATPVTWFAEGDTQLQADHVDEAHSRRTSNGGRAVQSAIRDPSALAAAKVLFKSVFC